jgi:hypothetical protein
MKRIPTSVLVKTASLCIILIVAGLLWRDRLLTGDIPNFTLEGGGRGVLPTLHHPVFEVMKLVAAFLVGLGLTAIHRSTGHDPAFGSAMEHAQVLLCVSGALMMIIIGDSLARAFGIAGAASIVRFRTPVENPKDTIVLFLALGFGMACGLGAFAVVGLGTAFVCAVLIYLSSDGQPKAMTLTLTAAEGEFPRAQVQSILTRYGIQFEPQEISSHGAIPLMRYRVLVDPALPLEQVSEELQAPQGDAGIQSVSWETKKKKS